MSIVNEALRKATKVERQVPQAENRKFIFSARHYDRSIIAVISTLSIFLVLIVIFFGIHLMPDLFFKKGTMIIKAGPSITNKGPNQLNGNLIEKKDDASKIREEVSRLIRQGLELYRTRRFNEAKGAFSRAISIQPNNAIALNNLGLIYMEEGNEKEAEINYRTALKVNPNYPEALNNLGLLYARAGNYEEAIRLYKGALKIKPDYPDSHLNLAILLERSGYTAEARRHYVSFIENAPKEGKAAILKVKNHIANLL